MQPISIKLNESLNRNKILALGKNLKGIETWKGVYINPDLTYAERVLNKQLRNKRK